MRMVTEYPLYDRNSTAVAQAVCHLEAASEDAVLSPEALAAKKRPGLDLVAVIDVSGSMQGEKLRLVAASLEFIVNQLRADDCLGLVTFDSNVNVALAPTKMDGSGRDKAQRAIQQLHSGSCTNLSGGLFKGIEMMQSIQRANGADASQRPATAIVLTDGMANEGCTNEAELMRLTRSLIGDKRSFSVCTFGYGSDTNPTLLKAIAEICGGSYYFVENADRAPEAFSDVLGGLLTTMAQSVELKLRVPAAAQAYCHIAAVETSYSKTLAADGFQATISLGSLQAEEVRDVVFTLQLKPLPAAMPAAAESALPHVEAELQFVNLVAGGFGNLQAELCISRPQDAPAVGTLPADELVRQQCARIAATKAMKEAMENAERGNFLAAQDCLNAFVASPMMAACHTSVAQDVHKAFTTMADAQVYRAKGRHVASSAIQSHSEQRCNAILDEDEEASGAAPAYITKSKSAWRGFAKSKVK